MNTNNSYRDEAQVLRCHHGNKLHLACDDCQYEERKRLTAAELLWCAKLLFVGSLVVTGICVTLWWRGLLF